MNTLLGFPESNATVPAFGRQLRLWRDARHMSQLALATEAGISTRHLSFLETGPAQPSREMVQLLAGMLDVPLGAPDLEPVRRALEYILRQQEPFPALVLDGQWNIVITNEAARRVFERFRGALKTPNVMRNVFAPNGLRPFIVNWPCIAECMMQTLHREVAAAGSNAVVQLRDEMLAYPSVPARWRTPDALASFPPLVAMHLRKGDVSMAFFSTITVFATPRDVMLQHLKIECFFPADASTEQAARQLASAEPIAV